MRLHKNFLGTNGQDKIDINEIAMMYKNQLSLLGNMVIIESGDNENGIYFKFGNGIMVCLGFKQFNIVLDQPWGSLYGAELGRLAFPQPFYVAPYVVPGTYLGNSIFITTSSGANYTHTPIYWAYQPVNITRERIIGLNYIAMGRYQKNVIF